MKKTQNLGIRVSRETKNKLTALSQELDLPVSTIVMTALKKTFLSYHNIESFLVENFRDQALVIQIPTLKGKATTCFNGLLDRETIASGGWLKLPKNEYGYVLNVYSNDVYTMQIKVDSKGRVMYSV